MHVLFITLLALQEPADEIARWIRQLRSENPAQREEAAERLRKIGPRAVPQLEKAAKDSDAEVAGRARDVLAAIEKAEAARREEESQALFRESMDFLQKAKSAPDEGERKKHQEEAVVRLRRIASEFPKTRSYGIAQFNAGVILCDFLNRPADAIREFEALIASGVDDKEETGNLMSPYRNYRYHSRRMMSACYEKLGKPGKALEAAYQMPAAYVSHCGTCVAGMNKGFADRVRALCGALEGADAEVVRPAADAAKSADGLLLDLGKRYAEAKRPAAARAALRAIVTDLPASPSAAEAGRLLEKLK